MAHLPLPAARWGLPAGALFRKYSLLFMTLVGAAVLASGLVGLYFTYQETKTRVVELQKEKAAAAALRIEGFIREIEQQLSWMKLPLVAGENAEQRRLEYLKLLRQAPAITDITSFGADGRQGLRISRLDMDSSGGEANISGTPLHETTVRKGRTYFGPVYFRKGTEPYMTMAVANVSRSTITAADLNLKFIWEVVSRIKVGANGLAYVVDSQGRLIAHPDISLVLRNVDLSSHPLVKTVLGDREAPEEAVRVVQGLGGQKVLGANSRIDSLGWYVFTEQPLSEAFAPVYDSILRTALLLLGGVLAAMFAGIAVARRITAPIAEIHRGAARLGRGDLRSRIDISTGDELEALAGQFNQMADELRQSYEGLEAKVVERTRELREALDQQSRLRAGLREALDRLELELSAARRLQLGMLPGDFPTATPERPIEVFATMEPAREVGGDLFDFFYDREGRLWFLIGDVSGKGAQAAMFMARARSLVRMAAELWQSLGASGMSPSSVAEFVNRELCQNNAERMFVTLLLGAIDATSGRGFFVNAGHPAPYAVGSPQLRRLQTHPAPPLGVRARSAYAAHELALEPGECLFAFTDGLLEAADPAGELFGEPRLQQALSRLPPSPRDLIASMRAEVSAFCAGAELADDLTMLALRWRSP